MENTIRIGAFAEIFDVPISTIRYYIKCGLLIPSRKNGQYQFNRYCRCDMQRINAWKEMMFSLNEIHELISLYRKYPTSYYKHVPDYRRLLRRKQDELDSRLQRNKASINKIKALLNQLPDDH